MATFSRRLRVAIFAIAMGAFVTACGLGPSATSSRHGDLARVLQHAVELKARASDMIQAATSTAVQQAPDAKPAFAAMVAIAATDQPWLASADLPNDVETAYRRVLKNVELNASRLTDGTGEGYFKFLGSSLAPLWTKDIDALRALAEHPDAS